MSYKGDYANAIMSLREGAAFDLQNNDLSTLVWRSDEADYPRPTDAEIIAEHEKLEAAWNAAEYARNRAAAYPSIGDQLDALFHAGVFPDTMATLIQSVKDKYPKGDA